MITTARICVSLLAVGQLFAGETFPPEPTPAQIAEIFGVATKEVSKGHLPKHPQTVLNAKWVANYEISCKKGWNKDSWDLTITLFPHDRIWKVNNLSTPLRAKNESEIEKSPMTNGDVIFHRYADLGKEGTLYLAELFNHEKDWDLAIHLFRGPIVDQDKFSISNQGMKLIPKIEALLRNQGAEQVGAGQPATAPDSKPMGKDKPQTDSESAPR